jgi:hypothetical protein
VETPRRKLKRMKKSSAGGNTSAPSLLDGLLSAIDFDQSEWEIMYPHFEEEGLVDPSDRTR